MATALIAPDNKRKAVMDLLNRSSQQISAALPKHLTCERMIRMAATLFNRTPALWQCEPMSIVACVIQSSELGLELTGPLGHAFMVPYKDQATFQIGYKGYFELGFRSGKLSAWPMRIVYANDVFQVDYGTSQKITHRPALNNRGDVTGYYSCLYLKDGGRDFEFMSREDVERHRDRYAKFKKPGSPWADSFDAMALKTTVRLLAKRAPLSTEIRRAASIDEYSEAGLLLPTVEAPDTPVNRIKNLVQNGTASNGDDAHDEAPLDPDQLATPAEIAAVEAKIGELGIKPSDLQKMLAGCGAESLTKATSGQLRALMIELEEMQ